MKTFYFRLFVLIVSAVSISSLLQAKNIAPVSGTITQPSQFNITVDEVTNVSCNGGSDGSIILNDGFNFTEDFESGNLNQWTQGTGAAFALNTTTVPPNGGIYSLEMHSGVLSTTLVGLQHQFGQSVAPNIISFDVNTEMSTAAGATGMILSFGPDVFNASDLITLAIAPGGTQQFQVYSGGSPTGSSVPYNTGQWYNMEFTNFDFINNTVDWYIDGTLQATLSIAASVDDFDQINVRNYAGLPEKTYVDNIEVQEGTGGNLTYNWENTANPGTSIGTGSSISNLSVGTYMVTATDMNGCTASTMVDITEPAAITSSATMTACSNGADGTITVTASGGTSPLQYSNDNGVAYQASNVFSGLAVGSYDIVVEDANGCTTVAQTVMVTSCFSVTTDESNVSCNGGNDGSVEVTVTGGTAPYSDGTNTYNTNPFTIAGLSAGAYAYTITDNSGATASISGTITEPSAVTLSLDNTSDVSCSGGSDGALEVSASGGTVLGGGLQQNVGAIENTIGAGGNFSAITAQWLQFTVNQSINIDAVTVYPNGAGDIEVLIQNVNTGVTDVVVVAVNGSGATQIPIGVSLSPGDYTMRAGSNTTTGGLYRNTSGAAYPYTTSNGAISITGNSFDPNYYYFYYDWVVSSGVPYNYAWSSGQMTNSISGLSSGSYTVTATDMNGCTDVQTYTISEPSAITSSATMTACSNGADGEITVTASGGTGTLEYSSDNGVTYQASNVLSGLAVGSYDIVVKDANDCTTAAQTVMVTSCFSAVVSNTSDETCPGSNDGTIEITVTGGAAPYTIPSLNATQYTTNPFTIENVSAGTYTFDVFENGGNSVSLNATIGTTADNTPPTVITQNITIQLDAMGNATVTAAAVNNGSTDNCSDATELTFGLSPTNFDCSNVGGNTVTLTVTDAENNSATGTATVTVVDQIPPIVTCNDFTAQLDANGVATISVADIMNTATDNCGVVAGGQLTQSSFNCDDAGDNMVTLTVIDVNGLSGSCQATVMVNDEVIPTAVCQDITVQLDVAGNATITGEDLDGGSSDSCGSLTFSATPNTFGCGDVGANTVNVTVTDGSNNTGGCTAIVTVEDNVAPTAVCQNITIPLDENGAVSITANDVNNGSIDACGVTLEVNLTDFDCTNIGTNTVSLTATDPTGNTASCSAVVTVIDPIAANILCRPDVNTINDPGVCGATVLLLPPVVIEENCSIVEVSNDAPTLFELGTTTVTWTLTDAGNNETQCTQNVTVNDTEAPTVECGQPFHAYLAAVDPDPLPFPYDNSCQFPSYLLDPIMNITDNCGSGTLTITNDAPQFFPPGQYTVTYTFTDAAGNVGTCEQSVKVWDITPPELTSCPDDIAVVATETDGANVSWSLPTAVDNCTMNDIFLVEANGYNPGNFFPIGETPISYNVYDENGQFSVCEFTVTVTPEDAPNIAIAGLMATEVDESIQNVSVQINGAMNATYLTTEDGLYNFSVPFEGDYTIAPQKDMDYLNGVSTYDLVLINKHILGVELLDSPYKMIAADVNKSNSISTLDLVQIQKLILLINDDFPNNTSWRFISSTFEFADPTNPFGQDFPEIINFNNLAQAQMNADFVGVKIGDVSGNASANLLLGADDRTLDGTLNLTTENVDMKAGETYEVTFTAENFHHFGYQFTMKFATNKVEFVGITDGLAAAENFGLTLLSEGAITASWNKANAVRMATHEPVFTMTFIAKADVQLSDVLDINSQYTKAEAYAENGDLQDVQLNFAGMTTASTFELYQNRPNPFNDETTIAFNLPIEQNATVTVSDVSGKVLKVIQNNFAKGYNEINLAKADLNATGVLYYTLVTSENSSTKMMVLTK